jgi:hypothetical protein
VVAQSTPRVAVYAAFQQRRLGSPWGSTIAVALLSIVAGVIGFTNPPATLAAITRKTINTVERGVFLSSTVLALKLARALGTSVERLFSLP